MRFFCAYSTNIKICFTTFTYFVAIKSAFFLHVRCIFAKNVVSLQPIKDLPQNT